MISQVLEKFSGRNKLPKGLWRNREETTGLELVRGWTGTDKNGEVNMRNQAERALDAIVSNLFFVLLKAI